MFKKMLRFLLTFVLVFSTFLIRAQAFETQPETEKVIKFVQDNKDKYPTVYALHASGIKDDPSKDQHSAMDNFVYLAKALRGMGFSPASAGGICGNAHVECSMNPAALENGRSLDYILAAPGRGLGYFQWSEVADKQAIKAMGEKMKKSWADRDVQLAFFKAITVEKNHPRSRAHFCKTKITGRYLPIYSKFKHEPFKSTDEMLKSDDAERVAILFSANWEVCNAEIGAIPTRVKAAKEYAEIIAACIDGSTSLKDGKDISDKLTKIADDASLEELMLSKGVKEYQEYLTDKLASYDSLSSEEKYNAAVIRGGISKGDVSDKLRNVRTILSVLGWIVFLWGFIGVICWLMANRDSLIAETLLKIILVRRGTKSKMTLLACVLMMAIGVFALSGGLFFCLVKILNSILY